MDLSTLDKKQLKKIKTQLSNLLFGPALLIFFSFFPIMDAAALNMSISQSVVGRVFIIAFCSIVAASMFYIKTRASRIVIFIFIPISMFFAFSLQMWAYLILSVYMLNLLMKTKEIFPKMPFTRAELNAAIKNS